jgi:CheY-like chemotaxis protein
VVTDQAMPDMTGIELAREFRAVRPDIPVILVTGSVIWSMPLPPVQPVFRSFS